MRVLKESTYLGKQLIARSSRYEGTSYTRFIITGLPKTKGCLTGVMSNI